MTFKNLVFMAATALLAVSAAGCGRKNSQAPAPPSNKAPCASSELAMAISQQAHNMIAVIRAWIVTGMAESPEQVVDVYLTLAPAR